MAGSTGKTFFAAVALQLIEAGRLDLEAPISKYLGAKPWFPRLPNAKDITVRMLMTHTSGLVRYEMNPKFTADLRANPDKAWTPEEELSYLFDATPPFAAGQGWDYSDTNYIVLGMIMEGITGTKLYDEVQRRFLGPLKLSRVAPTTSRRIPGLAARLCGSTRPARSARRGRHQRRLRDQSAVRMDGRRVRDERSRSRALGARAVCRPGDLTEDARPDDLVSRARAPRTGNQVRSRRHRPSHNASRTGVGTQRILSRIPDRTDSLHGVRIDDGGSSEFVSGTTSGIEVIVAVSL
jgi:CubicO group peptidase (beta-lactamase class C family)